MWVTAMGAFLLLAAAAVFVAVQWHQIPDEIKLGILAALTGGFLLAGRQLRSALPATGGVLYHLGAFLIPINVAAVCVHLDLPRQHWPWFVLVEGATAALAWVALDRVEHSPVLRWAITAAVVVTAGGFGATTSVPSPLVLAAAAALALMLGRHRNAKVWAAIAGLAPCLVLAERALPFGTDVLESLGLAGSTPHLTALVSGVAAAVVLGWEARRDEDLVLVVLAALSAAIGITTAWVGLAPTPSASIVGAATLFVLAEVSAHVVRRDPFWAAPARALGAGAEVVVATLTPLMFLAAIATLAEATGPRPAWSSLAAGALVAVAWFIADLRRRQPDATGTGLALLLGGGFLPATIGGVVAVMTGVIAGTVSPVAIAVTGVALAALLVVSGRPGGHAIAVMLATASPLVVWQQSFVLVGVAAVGAVALAGAAVVRARLGDRTVQEPLALLLACAAIVPVEEAHAILRGRVDLMVLLVATALAAWALAAILDRAVARPDTPATAATRATPSTNMRYLGGVGRLAALATLLQATAMTPSVQLTQVAVLAGILSGLAILDALLLDDEWPMLALPITLPVLVGTAAYASGLTLGQTGVALCVLAAVAAGVQLLLDDRWGRAVLGTVITSSVVGLALASSNLAAGSLGNASTCLLIISGIAMAYSAVHRAPEGFVFAWVGVTLGVWGHLVAGEIVALDAYLAPVAIGLVLAGWRARGRSVSSWVAFGPAVIILGGSALLERIDGGGGVHAIVAGAVGIAALLAGGTRRLAAPLLLGTALLFALTVHESLGVTRDVPTWGWLALGGTVLLLAGVAMERLDTGPVETGRRIVDVVSERFT